MNDGLVLVVCEGGTWIGELDEQLDRSPTVLLNRACLCDDVPVVYRDWWAWAVLHDVRYIVPPTDSEAAEYRRHWREIDEP